MQKMAGVKPLSYEEASAEARAVMDEIKAARNVPDVNNVWKYLANRPTLMRRFWNELREVMGPGALEPAVKEMIYLAVSITNGCEYCVASHTAAAQRAGMTDAMHEELLSVIAVAHEGNRIATALAVPVDPQYR
jgi:AhpD family alkylhydroperoxidase